MALDFKDLAKLKWYYQVLIVGAVCGGLLGGFWYEYLQDIQQQIQTKTGQVQELQKTIAKSLQQEKELEKIKKDAVELQAKLDMLKMVLPQEKETDEIFRDVQKLATTSGLQVSKVTPRNTIDHEVYTEYPIDLDVTGTFHNVGGFLDRIRQLPRIVSIGGLRLQGKASQGEAAFTSSVGATYTATTFVYKDEPITSTAPAAKPVK
jgi:type IV pilus assembly protein PilO